MSGWLENSGTRTACQILVSVTVFSSLRQVVAMGTFEPDPPILGPGNRSRFSGELLLPAGARSDPHFQIGEPTARVGSYSLSCED